MFKVSPFQFYFANSKIKKIFSEKWISFPEKGLSLVTGPSGSGKSTFLSCLKGLCPYHIPGILEGQIFYKNELISEDFTKSKSNEIVYLFQNPFNQIIYSKPQLEFAFTAESQKIPFKDFSDRSFKIISDLHLDKIANKKTFELSLGQAQRLLLASLLVTKPKVLLLDEPTAFMDHEARIQFYQLLKLLKQEMLIILVDHHLDEVSQITDHSIWVDQNGKIEECSQVSHYTNTNLQQLKLELSSESPKKINQSYVQFNQVNFFYTKNEPILKNVDLVFSAPDIIIIKGKNGVGKSTLFKLISGLIKPKKGKIIVKGKIAFVMQNPEDNFIFDTAAEEIAEVDADLIHRFFKDQDLNVSSFSLSEGEKRRLSLLTALNQKTDIILYDEPSFGLDYQNKYLVAKSLLQFKQRNILQIVISHDEAFIKAIADKVYLMADGSLYEQ